MPTLVSPGVDVSVIDESFYASSGPGTIPLVFFATRENKPAPGDATSYAPGSLQTNADKLFLITSQRELIQTFGEPTFVTSAGTPIHGDERNEYGLHAVYQYLGIANRAYVIRADIDVGELDPVAFEPTGDPVNGTYWFDAGSTIWGIFRSNGEENVNPYSDWDVADTVLVVEALSQSETAIFGDTRVATTATTIITASGDLDINGTTISLTLGMTLADVVTAIDSATITSIDASVDYNAQGVGLKLRHILGGDLDVSSSDSSVITDLGLSTTSVDVDDARPNADSGTTGNFAVVTLNNLNRYFEKKIAQDTDGVSITSAPAEWYYVGSDHWRQTIPTTVVGTVSGAISPTTEVLNITVTLADDTTVNGVVPLAGSSTIGDVASAIAADSALSAYFTSGQLNAEADGTTGGLRFENLDGGQVTITGTGATLLGIVVDVSARQLYYAAHTSIPANSRADDVYVKTTEPNDGSDWIVKIYNDELRQWVTVDAPFFVNDAAATASYGSGVGAGVLYVYYDTLSDGTANQTIRRWDGSTWSNLIYEGTTTEPTTEASEGTLWYNTSIDVDIMVGNGQKWLGLQNHPWYQDVDIILSGSKPTQKDAGSPGAISSGSTVLVENDIWIDTSDLENYPKIYRWNNTTKKWVLVDNTDQTTPFGIVFADARWGTVTGSQLQEDLVVSNYVDPDAPNPLTYPDGMLLFNMRLSTLNVKEWQADYLADYTSAELLAAGVNPAQYEVGTGVFSPIADDDTGRWVTTSGNQNDGAPWMARKAQRQVIVRALQSAVSSNEDIRAESVFFNLIAAPGYTELLDEMVTLNYDKKLIAFIVGDTPARLASDGTSTQNWATNAANAATNGDDALLTQDTYVGMYYPWGLSTNIDGFEVMIPPSTMALRTLAYNDIVSYQWFAPAGFNRGIVSNAQSVGYLDSESEYVPVILNQGQRDVLYLNKINPIAYMPGQGLVIWGQKSLHPVSSALDRINVVRLINYLRYNFDIVAKPYLFEPNDAQTRDSVESTFERFLADLITLRALYDFAVVCDESNNTPTRIDRNELWVDVAIKPVKAIEFIYIPIRVLNTGDELPG